MKRQILRKHSEENNEDKTPQSGGTKMLKRVPAYCEPSGSKPVASSGLVYSFQELPFYESDPVEVLRFIDRQRTLNGQCGVVYCAKDTESPTEEFKVLKKVKMYNEKERFLPRFIPTKYFLLMKCVDGNIPSIYKMFVKKNSDKPLLPTVILTQRNSEIVVTFCVKDCKNPIIEIEPEQIIFESVAGSTQKVYEVTIPLFGVIEPERTKVTIGGRRIELVLQKTSSDAEYWPYVIRENINFQGDDSGDKPPNKSSNNKEMSKLDHTDKCKKSSDQNQGTKETEENVTRRSKRPIKPVIRMNL